MEFYDKYTTGTGLPFYANWAFYNDANEIYDANQKALEEYDGRYHKMMANETVEQCMRDYPDKMVYVLSDIAYGKHVYAIKNNPENLTGAEIALIVDRGNLCFGFYVGVNRVEIYTD